MTKRLLFLLLLIFPLTAFAEAPANLRLDAKAPMQATCQAVSDAPEEARFRVLFARPTVIAAGSRGIKVIEEVEQVISSALRADVAAAEAG